MTRYALAWCIYLATLFALIAAMHAAGVPFWARNVYAFACGWFMAKPLRRLREQERER